MRRLEQMLEELERGDVYMNMPGARPRSAALIAGGAGKHRVLKLDFDAEALDAVAAGGADRPPARG